MANYLDTQRKMSSALTPKGQHWAVPPEEQRRLAPDPDADRWDFIEQWPMITKRSSRRIVRRAILAKVTDQLGFDCSNFLSVERIKSNVIESALWWLLVAGTVAMGMFYFLSNVVGQ